MNAQLWSEAHVLIYDHGTHDQNNFPREGMAGVKRMALPTGNPQPPPVNGPDYAYAPGEDARQKSTTQ